MADQRSASGASMDVGAEGGVENVATNLSSNVNVADGGSSEQQSAVGMGAQSGGATERMVHPVGPGAGRGAGMFPRLFQSASGLLFGGGETPRESIPRFHSRDRRLRWKVVVE